MRRPSAAREALRFSPVVEARGADASSIKRIPRMTALAEPFVLLPGRPAAERAADARRFRLAGFPLFIKFAIRNYDQVV